ncbi:MAG: DUF362 domain-containing protein [Eubacteriales bacterium]|nr:DUF362 domain-containing protein [Eubacteriales bacterium]
MNERLVILRQIPKGIDLQQDYVALPKNYGTIEYFNRPDIMMIKNLVFETLDSLESSTHFVKKMSASRNVIIKPNLVSVYHNSGMVNSDYPESTDPRVLDFVIEWVQKYNTNVVIAESSGKPMPTRTSFKVSGVDRVAKYRKTQLVALETCTVRRYILPKAKVMKEIYLPEPFIGTVEGHDFYISVPKLKTNLYTQVTLGFKNAMGAIPYALRERNHSYHIDEKLADMLYILKPDLTLIDGLVGGEGNTPAPVDPVDSRILIAGLDPVATDRVGAKIMGFNPDEIPLFIEVAKRGFFHGEAQVDGEMPIYHFRPADASLLGDPFHKHFPNVLVLAGHNLPHAPKVDDPNNVTPEIARHLEGACRGGCLAALRSGFEYVVYAPKKDQNRELAVVIGGGVECQGNRWWFDRNGKPYSEEQIRSLEIPLLTLGNCASRLEDIAKWRTPGCCSPSVCMLAATSAMKIPFPLLSLKNKSILNFGLEALKMVGNRSIKSLNGKWVDCPSSHIDQIYPVPKVNSDDAEKDFIPWPLPKMDFKTRIKLVSDQLSMLKL